MRLGALVEAAAPVDSLGTIGRAKDVYARLAMDGVLGREVKVEGSRRSLAEVPTELREAGAWKAITILTSADATLADALADGPT